MLTAEEAKKIGIRACVDKLGYEFCKKHADNSTSAWGEDEKGIMNCFVGVNTEPAPNYDINCVEQLVLTSGRKWTYAARCNVYMDSGKVEFTECRVP